MMIHIDARKSGFTLFELSIVLVVFSIVVGGGLTVINAQLRAARYHELQVRMDKIEDAIQKFRRMNNRLPCPADGTILITDADFGIEASNAGICTGTPAANFSATDVAGGVVPVRSLGIADDLAFDPWGGRFTYIVDKDATASNQSGKTFDSSCTEGSTSCGPTDTTNGSITIKDGDTPQNDRTTKAMLAIVSHGGNGHGAFQESGVRKSWGSTNTDELENCDCTNAAANGTFNATLVMKRPVTTIDFLDSFDDTVRYYLRSSNALLSAEELGDN